MMWSEVGIERKRGVSLCLFGVQDMSSSESTTAELIGVVTVFLLTTLLTPSQAQTLASMPPFDKPSSSDCLMYSDR